MTGSAYDVSSSPARDVWAVDERDGSAGRGSGQASLRARRDVSHAQLSLVDVRDGSREASRDGSLAAAADGSSGPVGARSGRCAWCGGPLPRRSVSGRRRQADADTCSKRCRQNRWRWRVERSRLERAARPMRFAYADPPYPGRAGYYLERQEVDHDALIARLVTEFPDGWALSTAADALQPVLALCPPGVRVCSWHRAVRRTRSRRALSAWEPLIVCGGRELLAEAPQTVIDALIARGRHRAFPGALVGMKPPAFAVWVFQQLGALPGDQLTDLFPGSGAVTRAWSQHTSTETDPATSRDARTEPRP